MARPLKSGLDYFPLDVHDDDKIKFIRIKYKVTGVAIVFELYRKIYANSFFSKWSDDEALIFSDSIKADYDLVNDVIKECLKRGIFDSNKYSEHNILTSKGIQDRYAEVSSRRKNCKENAEFFVIDSRLHTSSVVSVSKKGVNVHNNPSSSVVNDYNSTQSKVKESKVKKRKEDESVEIPKNPTEILEHLKNKFPKGTHTLSFCEDFYNKWTALDWIDSNKVPISWKHKVIFALNDYQEKTPKVVISKKNETKPIITDYYESPKHTDEELEAFEKGAKSITLPWSKAE